MHLHINLNSVVEFRAKQAQGRAYFGFQSHFSESKISHTSHTFGWSLFFKDIIHKHFFCMFKAIKTNLDEKINSIEFIFGPISPSGSLFGPKLQNCTLYILQTSQNPTTTKIYWYCKMQIIDKEKYWGCTANPEIKRCWNTSSFFNINRALLHFNTLDTVFP